VKRKGNLATEVDYFSNIL